MNLTEFKNWLTIYCTSSKTVQNYFEAMKRFSLQYPELNQENIHSYISSLIEQKKSRSAINQFIYALRKYCEFARLQFDIPKPRKQKDKIKPYLTEEEMKEIVKKVKYIVRNPIKYMALIQFLFYTGLRREELINLKREDINLDKCTVNVHETKTDTARIIVFPPSLLAELNLYFLKDRENINAFNVTYQSVYEVLTRIGKECGYADKCNPHAFRHACAHYLLKITGNQYQVVQKMLGHVNIATTMHYVDMNNEEAINKLEKIYSNK